MHKYNAFKVLIFDLGNTILPINPQKTVLEFEKLGFKGNILMPKEDISEILESYQQGKISSLEFLSLIKAELPPQATTSQIINAWNAMLLDFPAENIALLRELKQTHLLLLLSNTNDLHAKFFETKANEQGFELSSLFDAVYYSHELEMSKPNTDIYTYIHEKEQLENKTVLFLDDLAENLEFPQKIGWETQLISEKYSILDLK